MHPEPVLNPDERPVSLRGHALYALWLTALGALPVYGFALSLRWPASHRFVLLLALEHAIQAWVLWRLNPTLVRHRITRKEGVASWDRKWMLANGSIGLLLLGLPGLQQAAGASHPYPLPWVVAALVLHALGAALTSWAMASNPHFEGGVRLQQERQHQTIAAGPYGLARHPGYLGFMLLTAPVPILLESTWGLAPAALMIALLGWRTWQEDAYLAEHLPGYLSYASQVRHRLLPGIW